VGRSHGRDLERIRRARERMQSPGTGRDATTDAVALRLAVSIGGVGDVRRGGEGPDRAAR
jgi:hypothetical protein